MYQGHSVKRKILHLQSDHLIHSNLGQSLTVCFSVGERTAAKEGKGDGLPVGAKKELSHPFTLEAEKSHRHQANRRRTSKSVATSLLCLQQTPSASTSQLHNSAPVLSLKAARLWYPFYHPITTERVMLSTHHYYKQKSQCVSRNALPNQGTGEKSEDEGYFNIIRNA